MNALFRFCSVILVFIAGIFCVAIAWGADHIQVRNVMIEAQLAQVEDSAILVVGDSIIESWLASPVGSCELINAGLGGGGVRNVLSLLARIKDKKLSYKISEIIIAIGVNDSQRREMSVDYLSIWENDYAKMLDTAIQLNPNIYVLTILPVEDGMALGSNYFDNSLIERMNVAIRKLAKSKNVQLIDASKAFRHTEKSTHLTIDGVHLTPHAYKIFSKQLLLAMPSECRSSKSYNMRHKSPLFN